MAHVCVPLKGLRAKALTTIPEWVLLSCHRPSYAKYFWVNRLLPDSNRYAFCPFLITDYKCWKQNKCSANHNRKKEADCTTGLQLTVCTAHLCSPFSFSSNQVILSLLLHCQLVLYLTKVKSGDLVFSPCNLVPSARQSEQAALTTTKNTAARAHCLPLHFTYFRHFPFICSSLLGPVR